MRAHAAVFALSAALASSSSLPPQQPHTALVNLPRHTERLAKVTAVLQDAGIEFDTIAAVDGALLSPAELEANVTAAGRLLLTRGMIGCFLSHRRCWERCVASGTTSSPSLSSRCSSVGCKGSFSAGARGSSWPAIMTSKLLT